MTYRFIKKANISPRRVVNIHTKKKLSTRKALLRVTPVKKNLYSDFQSQSRKTNYKKVENFIEYYKTNEHSPTKRKSDLDLGSPKEITNNKFIKNVAF
jgi:hypothetical protein